MIIIFLSIRTNSDAAVPVRQFGDNHPYAPYAARSPCAPDPAALAAELTGGQHKGPHTVARHGADKLSHKATPQVRVLPKWLGHGDCALEDSNG